MILILTDHEVAARERLQEGDDANQVDVGTAAQNMMTMAHALGLGACPVTSFSKSGVAGVLSLPASLTPELMLIVGHPLPVTRAMPTNAPKPVRARDLTYWEEVGRHSPAATFACRAWEALHAGMPRAIRVAHPPAEAFPSPGRCS